MNSQRGNIRKIVFTDLQITKIKASQRKKGTFPAEIIKAMLENADFKRLHEQRKKPRKEYFQRLLVNKPPLPDSYTWYNLMEKFSGIMNGKY